MTKRSDFESLCSELTVIVNRAHFLILQQPVNLCSGDVTVTFFLWRTNRVFTYFHITYYSNCSGETQQQLQFTDPSSHHRGHPIVTTPQLSKDNFKEREKKSWSRVPDSDLTPGQISRLTVRRKITATLISILIVHEVSWSECGLSLVIRVFQTRFKLQQNKQTPWSESASKLYRPSDRRFSAKWLPTFADKGCHVVSVTDPSGRILDKSRYFSIK
jgi:hypothetical protein